MTKLETLYASIKGLQDLGLPLNDETLNTDKRTEIDRLVYELYGLTNAEEKKVFRGC